MRDNVKSTFSYNLKSTYSIIDVLKKDQLPNQVMLNIHPQRWNDNHLKWLNELISQNLKNYIKKMVKNYRRLK